MNLILVPDAVMMADGTIPNEPTILLVHGGSVSECTTYCEAYYDDWSMLGDLILSAPGAGWLAYYACGGWRTLSVPRSVPTPDNYGPPSDFDNEGKPLWIVE